MLLLEDLPVARPTQGGGHWEDEAAGSASGACWLAPPGPRSGSCGPVPAPWCGLGRFPVD